MPHCCVPANTCNLIGRTKEEQQLKDGLRKWNSAIVSISGGPGEGKTALAQKVVWDMWEGRSLSAGAYTLNLAGWLLLTLRYAGLKASACFTSDLLSHQHCLLCAGVFPLVEEPGDADVRNRLQKALADLLLSNMSWDEVRPSVSCMSCRVLCG